MRGLIIACAMIFLGLVLPISSSYFIKASVDMRVESLSADELREAADHLMSKYYSLLQSTGGVQTEMYNKMEKYIILERRSRLYDELAAPSIVKLNPTYLVIYSNRVYLALSKIQRKGVWVFDDSATVYGTRELGERVWYGEGETGHKPSAPSG